MKRKKRRVCSMFKIFSTYICWIPSCDIYHVLVTLWNKWEMKMDNEPYVICFDSEWHMLSQNWRCESGIGLGAHNYKRLCARKKGHTADNAKIKDIAPGNTSEATSMYSTAERAVCFWQIERKTSNCSTAPWKACGQTIPGRAVRNFSPKTWRGQKTALESSSRRKPEMTH